MQPSRASRTGRLAASARRRSCRRLEGTASRTKESREYFVVYLAGKMIGLMAVIAIAYVFMKFLGDKALRPGRRRRRLR